MLRVSTRFIKKKFQGFPNFFYVFKRTQFKIYSSLKITFKTMWNGIKKLKRHCKATLNRSFDKKLFDDNKKFVYRIDL